MIFGDKIKLERMELPIPKFRGLFVGSKLIHLSDLHISKFGIREKKVVRLVQQEQPDIILITGDIVTHYTKDFSACIEFLRNLHAKFGVFIVLGNSEHTLRPRKLLEDFVKALDALNVTLLTNRSVKLILNGEMLFIAGVDDPFYQFDKFEEAIKEVPIDAPTILLAHSPDILFPRTDALVVNLIDSISKNDRFKDWGWKDSTYFSPEDGDVYFQNTGDHTVRVQSRQDGVSLDVILLNPYEEIDRGLNNGNFKHIEQLLSNNEFPAKYPELVCLPVSSVAPNNLHGKWKMELDDSALSEIHLNDLPATKDWNYQPLIHPTDYFETSFFAQKGIKYHIWARLKAHKGSPFNDSVYLQFNDSVDKCGNARYRLGKPACCKDRMSDMDLILSGHTHGGQVRIPFYGSLTTLTSMGKKYDAGLHRFGRSILYVSRGIGCSALPVRLFCSPEITVFSFK